MTDGRQVMADRHGMPRHGRQIPCALALGLTALAHAADVTPIPVQPVPSVAPTAVRQADAAAATSIVQTATANALGPAIDDARFLLAAGRAREAAARLDDALAAAGSAADPAQRSAATDLLAQARASERTGDSAEAVAQRTDAAAAARGKADQDMVSRTDLRSERLARIADLRSRGLQQLALATCRKLLSDLPGDEEVDSLFRDLLAEAHQARSTAVAERERELRTELAQTIERSLIPEGFDGQPMYPSDWADRRSGRNSQLEISEHAPAWMEQINDRLAERTTVSFDATPVADALDLVARLAGINIVTAPEILAAADRTITLRANGMRLDSVLSWICDQAGTRWSLANGGIFVGEQADSQRQTAIHDIGELLVGTGDFPGPQIAMNGGDDRGFSTTTEEGTPPPTADDVADLIKRSVSPRTWDDSGNGIIVRSNALFVTAPDHVQRLVREFLRAQSAQHSLSIRLENRWLELTDSYIEEIGVQWTSGTGTLIDPNNPSSSGLVRKTNGWSIDGSTGNILPSTAMAISPALPGTGLTLQSAIIGSTGLSAVLQTVEQNSQNHILQSPEILYLNDQQTHTFFSRQIAYITDYEASEGKYDPVIEIVNIGTSIDVRPLASADRKYVTLELRSASATATLFTDYITAANPDSTGVDLNGDGIIDIAFGIPLVYPIELPNLAVREIGTTVMLPDRGSMLVGGFGRSLDEFSATRVPLLGSIPFLGRLFGARGRYAERSNLYLLTTATIINYPELEARL
jgi:hypothetical protein